MFRTLFLSALILAFTSACLAPSMPYQKMQMRNLKPFTSIEIDGPMNVDIEETGQDFAGVFVEKEPSLNDVVTNVEDGVLKVTCNRGFINEVVPKVVILTSQKISSVKIKSAGNFSFESVRSDALSLEISGPTDTLISGTKDLVFKQIKLSDMANLVVSGAAAKELEINLDGSAAIEITGGDSFAVKSLKANGNARADIRNISSSALSVEMPGPSVLKVQGTADLLSVSASLGELKAAKLQVRSADVKADGAAEMKITVSESLKADLKNGASLDCSGEPPKVEKNIDSASFLTL